MKTWIKNIIMSGIILKKILHIIHVLDGAEIICDKNTTATFCCYCHGPIVLNDKFNEVLNHQRLYHLR